VSQQRYDIYFAGELMPDHPPEQVKQWLGAQFRLQGEALEQLFSGQPVRIKQDVDMDTAGRYRAAFRKAGALVEIRPATDQPAAPVATPGPAAAAASEPELLPPNTGSLEDCAAEIAATPLPAIDHIDLAAPEQPLDDRPPPPPAAISTEHLSATPPNSGDLSDCAPPPPDTPLPDISRLQLTDD